MTVIKRLFSLCLAFVLMFSICVPTFAANDYSTVRFGSKSNDVKTMQKMLNTVMDANLVEDGFFGSASKAVVIKYQKSRGLAADGICGRATWSALTTDYKDKMNSFLSSTHILNGTWCKDSFYANEATVIDGIVKSSRKIDELSICIKNEQGKAIYKNGICSNSKEFNIKSFNIVPGDFPAGNYTISITVSNDLSSDTVLNKSFTVNGVDILSFNTFEKQGKKMCILTSISMLLRTQLALQGDDFTDMTQYYVKSKYNKGILDASLNNISKKVNSSNKFKQKLTYEIRSGYTAQENIDRIKSLLDISPAGVVVYFYVNNNNQHAVLFRDYDDTSGAFMVSDPGNKRMQYVKLENSLICTNYAKMNKNYDNTFKYVKSLTYFN